jgi:hypothetical protein
LFDFCLKLNTLPYHKMTDIVLSLAVGYLITVDLNKEIDAEYIQREMYIVCDRVVSELISRTDNRPSKFTVTCRKINDVNYYMYDKLPSMFVDEYRGLSVLVSLCKRVYRDNRDLIKRLRSKVEDIEWFTTLPRVHVFDTIGIQSIPSGVEIRKYDVVKFMSIIYRMEHCTIIVGVDDQDDEVLYYTATDPTLPPLYYYRACFADKVMIDMRNYKYIGNSKDDKDIAAYFSELEVSSRGTESACWMFEGRRGALTYLMAIIDDEQCNIQEGIIVINIEGLFNVYKGKYCIVASIIHPLESGLSVNKWELDLSDINQ